MDGCNRGGNGVNNGEDDGVNKGGNDVDCRE